MPLVGFTKNVGGWPLSAASSARLAFRIVMVAFEAWLKGWRSGMIRTPKRNVESSNLAGTSELDVILAHLFLVEVRGRGIWSRAGEQVKICPYHLRLDFLASEFQVVFLALSISHIIRCRTMISSRLSSPAKVSFISGDLVHWSHLSHVSLYQSWIAVLAHLLLKLHAFLRYIQGKQDKASVWASESCWGMGLRVIHPIQSAMLCGIWLNLFALWGTHVLFAGQRLQATADLLPMTLQRERPSSCRVMMLMVTQCNPVFCPQATCQLVH